MNLTNISFPISRNDIGKFEKLNNISINIYILRKNSGKFKCLPNRLTAEKRDRHVNLLLIQSIYYEDNSDDDDENVVEDGNDDREHEIKYHYVLIKNLSGLIRSSLNKHKGKIFICDRCLHYYHTQEKLRIHEEECSSKNKCKISFPKDNKVYFKNFVNKERVPIIVYADIECILNPVDITNGNSKKFHHHLPHSIGYYTHSDFDTSLCKYEMKRGDDCVNWFSNQLYELGKLVQAKHDNPLPMLLSSHEEYEFMTATNCWICKKAFQDENNGKVRDHNHFTGNL